MGALARNQASNCANPVLDVWIQVNGVLTDLGGSLEFIIYDVSDLAKQASPVQVYPPSGRQAVDLAACPTGDKVGTGRYVAEWTPDGSEPLGTHRITWWFKLSPSSTEQSFSEEFEVLPEAVALSDTGYCSIGDLRAEGVTVELVSDVALAQKIALASRQIDILTGNFFEPRSLTLELDGRGEIALTLMMPIIAIAEINTLDSAGAETLIESDLYRVYNRHLTQNLTQPDDRGDPRINFVSSDRIRGSARTWPRGYQNVRVAGVFGYTDYTSSNSQGKTPDLIARATMLLVMKMLQPLIELAESPESAYAHRITAISTRDQSISFSAPRQGGASGYLTGDEQIDSILERFMAPIGMGVANGW